MRGRVLAIAGFLLAIAFSVSGADQGGPVACATPNAPLTEIAGDVEIVAFLGEPLSVSGSFTNQGDGDDCPQLLNWVAQKVGGFPTSYANEGPASPNTVYTKPWTPDAVGLYDLWVQLIWGPNGWPVVYNVEDGNVIRVKVERRREEKPIDMMGSGIGRGSGAMIAPSGDDTIGMQGSGQEVHKILAPSSSAVVPMEGVGGKVDLKEEYR